MNLKTVAQNFSDEDQARSESDSNTATRNHKKNYPSEKDYGFSNRFVGAFSFAYQPDDSRTIRGFRAFPSLFRDRFMHASLRCNLLAISMGVLG